jgi:hypothetical protein
MPTITVQSFLKFQTKVNIEEFCAIWIPKLYGIQPNEYGYRKACMNELVRLTEGSASYNTIDKNWQWTNGEEKYPSYMKPLLNLAHQRYSVLDALGELRKHP